MDDRMWTQLLFLPLVCATLVDPYLQQKNFDTVLHYYSNAKVSGKSKLYFEYKNDVYKTVEFNLQCGDGNSTGTIQIEGVNLILPAKEEEYCLDSENTSFDQCMLPPQCECKVMPRDVCKQPAVVDYDYCNGKRNCSLEVQSNFLENCPGRDYDCDHKKCHSRWAEVIYRCQQYSLSTLSNGQATGEIDQGTLENTTVVSGIGTSEDTDTRVSEGSSISVIIGFVLVLLLGAVVCTAVFLLLYCGSKMRWKKNKANKHINDQLEMGETEKDMNDDDQSRRVISRHRQEERSLLQEKERSHEVEDVQK